MIGDQIGVAAVGETNGVGKGPGSGGGPLHPVDPTRALTDELRSLVTIRSRVSVRDRVLPTLFALLPPELLEDKERRFAALRDLIDEGIAHIDDPDHRAAAAPLYEFGPGRWRPLTERGPEAAAAFGCGWDAYRRRRTNGVSLLDETTAALARALHPPTGSAPTAAPATVVIYPVEAEAEVERDTAADFGVDVDVDVAETELDAPQRAVPSDEGSDAPGVVPAGDTSDPGPRRWLLVAGISVLVCIVLGSVAFRLLTTDASVDCRLLTHHRGDVAPNADSEVRAWAPAFADAGDDLGAGASECADELARLHGVITQRVSAGDDAPAALLVAVGDDHRTVIGLHADEFAQFRELGADDALSRTGLGVPVRRRDRADGSRVVEFSDGLVHTEPGGPSRSVHNSFWTAWQDEGGFDGPLGAPVSRRYDDNDNGLVVQEFVGGELTISQALPDRPTVDLDPKRAAPLPPDPSGIVLRTGDGTAWLVGGDGVRHWLRTSAAVECAIAEQGASPSLRISAAAIDALPLGEEYECP